MFKKERIIEVPTGHIIVGQGEKGQLECLSIGDYGKDANIKCDALGLSREIEKVRHGKMLPLEEKWVITVSTQYGCSMGCKFCDVPKVGPGRNATFWDLVSQVDAAMSLHPEVKTSTRLNLHFARMGEPTWNRNVLDAAVFLKGDLESVHRMGEHHLHPVVSTMMPKYNKHLELFLERWMYIKNEVFEGEAGLQLSINSTHEGERDYMFSGNALPLVGIYDIMKKLPKPKGRKITLNFAVANYEIDPKVLLNTFDPEHFIIKLTPMHRTATAVEKMIYTSGDYTKFYPYKDIEEKLKKAGYDVLVFIASLEEDMSRITCGNAILAGTKPLTEYKEIST